MRRFAIVAAIAVAALVSRNTAAQAVHFQQAFVIAQDLVPKGQLVMARVEGDGQIFGFYFRIEGRVIEIEISVAGAVVKNKDSKDDDVKDKVSEDVMKMIEKANKGKTKLPDGRIMEIAHKALKDTPFKNLTYAKDGDNLVVKIGDDIVINAETGNVTTKK